jgi:PAS domain S-box-containing protein
LRSSAETGKIVVAIALIGIAVSFLLAYFIISFLTRPIREIAREAQDIAMGKREIRLKPRPGDEIGALTDALNSMLDSLKTKQIEIEEYARTLESRVEKRTAELLASEEKYRTLVENAPLIVYRVARDGTTEFVNSYLTENTGYTIEEAMSDRRFWRDKMAGIDQKAFDTINKSCFLERKQCRIESRVMAKDGRMLTFITHAIPATDSKGHIKWIDGIMLDITELKTLQEKAIQTEGIRTIGEISARMAHEIRNPLSAAGGFAHRLRESLKDDETNRKMAEIIVEEVAKLENFVRILLSSIEPFDLSFSEVDVNGILLYWIKNLDALLISNNITFINDFETDMPKIRADHERLTQSLGNILKHAVVSTPSGENIFISTFWLKDQILITLTHRVDRITASDMDKFFFPHIDQDMDRSLLDLPLSKIIIQRHGGKIDLIREEGDVLIMKIKFPLSRSIDDDNSESTA